ncbi:hypothetical protein [Saccharopolyspora gregorii]|uniref:hypothetical protein n=1 Tax=Saccharopolyspora gregorii TaxID=33914 RepID=UPI0031EA6E8D
MVPEHRTLLGIDVVKSANNPGYHAEEIGSAVTELLTTALSGVGIGNDDVLMREWTGDGVLLTLPGPLLGAAMDSAQLLDMAAYRRNQRRKPEIRLRVAIHVGPVADAPGYHPAKKTLNRMLDATAVKNLFDRCVAGGPDGEVSTVLIVSEHAKTTAFDGDYLRLLRIGEFSPLPVRNKEHDADTWVRVPGMDSRSIADLLIEPGGADTVRRGDAEERAARISVTNVVHGGGNNGVQAGVIHGDVNLGNR